MFLSYNLFSAFPVEVVTLPGLICITTKPSKVTYLLDRNVSPADPTTSVLPD